MGPGTRESCATGQAAMQAAGPPGPHDPADLMVPEASVVTDREALREYVIPYR